MLQAIALHFIKTIRDGNWVRNNKSKKAASLISSNKLDSEKDAVGQLTS